MKANQKHRDELIKNRNAFTFIIPLTMAIIVGFSLLAIGAYVVGTIGTALEDTFESNTASGSIDATYTHSSTSSGYRNITLSTDVNNLDGGQTYFYILASSALDYTLAVNGVNVNTSDNLSLDAGHAGWNTTLTYLRANSTVAETARYLNFSWSTTADNNVIRIDVYGIYFVSGDYRSENENSTVYLMGNVTDGFSDVVDIEIVVIIITALSMAILAIMAVGTRRDLF